jgi:glucose-6-phosphate 1-epimerase
MARRFATDVDSWMIPHMDTTRDALNRRFVIEGLAEIVDGSGGLLKVRVAGAAASGEMYLQGAHVTSWHPRGVGEMLFVSRRTRWEAGHPIRGGVPVCFPWFGNKEGDAAAPAHGFVRTEEWTLESIERADDAVTVSMRTGSSDATKRWWPADFSLVHRVTFGPTLTMELIASNTGTEPLRYEEALHSYHGVGHVEQVRVRGLDQHVYRDKVDAHREKTQQGEILFLSETDRMYLNASGTIEVEDAASRRQTTIAKKHSHTTVVWNPWIARAQALPDLQDDEWQRFICIEPSNVGPSAVALAPGEQHVMAVVISVNQP